MRQPCGTAFAGVSKGSIKVWKHRQQRVVPSQGRVPLSQGRTELQTAARFRFWLCRFSLEESRAGRFSSEPFRCQHRIKSDHPTDSDRWDIARFGHFVERLGTHIKQERKIIHCPRRFS